MDLEDLKRAYDEGLLSDLEFQMRLNLEKVSLLNEVIKMQKRLLREQQAIARLEMQISERRFFFAAALRDLDRLKAVTID